MVILCIEEHIVIGAYRQVANSSKVVNDLL